MTDMDDQSIQPEQVPTPEISSAPATPESAGAVVETTPAAPPPHTPIPFAQDRGHTPPAWSTAAMRVSPAGMDALRERVLGNGALTAVLEAIEDCMILFSNSGQLVHANAAALKTLDQVGVQGAVGLMLHELLGCGVEDVRASGCVTMSRCPNCDSIRMLLGVMDGNHLGSAVTLQIEQSSGPFTGKFDVKSAPVDIDGTRLRLLILRQRTALHRKVTKK